MTAKKQRVAAEECERIFIAVNKNVDTSSLKAPRVSRNKQTLSHQTASLLKAAATFNPFSVR